MRGRGGGLSAQALRERVRVWWGAWVEEPMLRGLSAVGVSPNALTLVGLVLTAPVAYLAATGRWMWAGGALLVAGLMDMLDGALARRTGRATPFGAFLDSLVDRVQEAGVLLGILVFYGRQGEMAGSLLAFLALWGSFLVSYTRARAEGLGVPSPRIGIMTRPERVLLLVVGLLTGWVVPALGVVAGLGFLTAVHRTYEVWRYLRRRG
ncbi:MAG: CDP-alcohol phosphatidyltransferase family protein [Dehalococcoidia bacterium]|nr:CDP-alcohol phosphatidyltransferase family protein [Dehalococcoidia bacterium]MDW8120230.1 CDP-alcohol phosphatidyltransferase family protein [Chloroflexota bacterium]